ncbi:histone-lysine N-methyltransferase SETMAR-like [Mercenaria mercenaria]|uniref:histone-lysine N-methyltransferase SETMAR-like n=1 Tax=Mercenaria mercenaria TaxID=6596 RepID=UPI00234F6959|nr:histone-lysine N-methyltransferase SETMAR-like [Mercenaria mercenaria]
MISFFDPEARFEIQRIAARWTLYLLTEDQKKQRVSAAQKLLKLYPKFNQRTFSNFVTGDDTWVHYYQPVRKCSNTIWTTKQARRPSEAKRIISVKKVMYYAVFFNSRGKTVQVAIPRGRTVTGKVYCEVEKRRSVLGLLGMTLLHINAPALKSFIVTQFLKHKGVSVLPLPPYSPVLAPCDFFLFLNLKKLFDGRRYHDRNALGSAIFQYPQTLAKRDYEDAFQ